jgi:hypothetical protein
MGIDVHMLRPLYADDEAPHSNNCPVVGGRRCWMDGSRELGRNLWHRHERAGHDGTIIRAELEDWYTEYARESA